MSDGIFIFNGDDFAHKSKIDQVQELRLLVFSEEYGLPKEIVNDVKDLIAECIHIVKIKNGEIVSTARALPHEEDDDAYNIGRVATKKEFRHKGFGSEVVNALLVYIQERHSNVERATLNANSDAIGFYEYLGFSKDGSEFEISRAGREPMILMSMGKEVKANIPQPA